MKEHWIPWVIAIICIVSVFFMVDAKVNFATLFSRSEQQEKQIDRQSDDLGELREKNASQDLEIQSNRIRVEHLEEKGAGDTDNSN